MSEKTGPEKQSGTQLWAGRSSGNLSSIAVEMGESISLDIQLYREDLRASLAHARMLAHVGILDRAELKAIGDGLRQIRQEIESNSLPLRPELEDIHTHVENRLTEIIGEAGKKLHTARSRNDQIAVDMHLFVRRACAEIGAVWIGLLESLSKAAAREIDTILPGYTHLQVAQPVRLSHHLLAHFWSFARDLGRLKRAAKTAGDLPLGSGALAGVNYETDREFLREELGFTGIYANSMDAVSTRDYLLDFLYALSVFATHASRLAEELILWNSLEFGFVHLPDELTTGSSIMPQKKNPDLAELSRGKSGRMIANLMNLLVNLKSLPLTYNRDLQEDRQPVLDSYRQSLLIGRALQAMIEGAVFDRGRMRAAVERGFATATDLADALVSERGLSFREAHHLVGNLVARAAEHGTTLAGAPATLREAVSPLLKDDEFYTKAISLSASTERKVSAGGTAKHRQEEQLQHAGRELEVWKDFDWRSPDLSLASEDR
ncbi:MAG: argininosuccinate lyase [Spirochaetales bacterium]|nr:argininosuccinate lyase [Leptospiraceae bacterium]MCP5480662.1 argininosuccinate lyase [Spirochaetales bacterium]MCP5484014.1 argininosuccinate lyase [Spirochaetales bacterium]